MTALRYRAGRQLHPSEVSKPSPFEKNRSERVKDKPLDRPKRPCLNCGRKFQPTKARQMLCLGCYRHGQDSPFAPL